MKAPQALIEAMERENDVRKVHRLEFSPARELWLYLIETPFETFPRFVVGWTDAEVDQVQLVTKHGEQWAAEASFYRTLAEAVQLPGQGRSQVQLGNETKNEPCKLEVAS